MKKLRPSVIITTYQRPQALALVLQGLAAQTEPPFEVIVAEDGQDAETAALIQRLSADLPYPLLHVVHEDLGFRAAKIRNKAVAKANGDYLIFLDGDCIPRPTFIKHHLNLAEEGWFVSGNRVLLNQGFTQQVEKEQLPIYQWSLYHWVIAYVRGYCNRWLTLCYLPFFKLFNKNKSKSWKGAITCNLAIWKKDFIMVNGFDEAFEGWGYEDTDLVIRLFNLGCRRIKGYFSIAVIHLWHRQSERSQAQSHLQRVMERQKNNMIMVEKGVDQYL